MTDVKGIEGYCSTRSRQSQEQLFGTASRVDVWFALEYNAPWVKRAFDESAVPPAVRQHLNSVARTTRHVRTQLIKRPAQAAEYITFYAAVSREFSPALYEFHLSSYDELLSLDLQAITAGDLRYDSFVTEEPVFLVCTHGAHDRCCALLGTPVYTQLAQHTTAKIWQTSHLGGHRFAANVVSLPHGIYYGHVAPRDAHHVVAAAREQCVLIENYRGRSCYDTPTQVADYYLRQKTGIRELAGLRFLSTQPLSATDMWVSFLSTSDGVTHRVHIARDVAAVYTITSCGATSESSVDQFRFVEHVSSAASDQETLLQPPPSA